MVAVDGAMALLSRSWRWWFRSRAGDVGLGLVEGPPGGGARVKKRGKLFRERASAMLFSLPGKCDRRMVKLCWAATRNRVRSSRMRSGCFADCYAHAWTMGRLSQWKWMPAQR